MSLGILPELIHEEQQSSKGDWVVRVFNNDSNTYDEVIEILMAATGCDAQEAYMEAWEIDHLGSSVVHFGAQKECKDAAGIIATIGIRVGKGISPTTPYRTHPVFPRTPATPITTRWK